MDTHSIAEIKEKLIATKESLEKQLAELSAPVDMGDDIDSFDEETDEATEFSANQGMALALKRRHRRVLDALSKIESGTYGICEKCGKQIEAELLAAAPESRLCRADKVKIQK